MILHSPSMIERYTRQGYWGNRTLLDRFAASCAAHPQRPAVVDPLDRDQLLGTPPRSLHYAELQAAVDAVAGALQRRGLRQDDIVIAQLPNVWELAMLYLAVATAGGILSPLPMQWRSHDVGYVAGLAEARFYIGTEGFKVFDYLGMAHELGIEQVISLHELDAMAQTPGAAPVDVRVDANDVFTLCWTSGTEAEPKGCPMTHNVWQFMGSRLVHLCGLQDGCRQLCVAPLVNMTGVGVNFIPWLLTAGTLVLHHPLNAEVLLRQLTGESIAFTILVPAILNTIVKLPNVDQLDLSSVRTITTGSAPPSAWSLQEFKRRWDIEIVNIWGQNEGSHLVAGPDDVPELEKRVDHFPFWGLPGRHWPSGMEDGLSLKLLDDTDNELRAPGAIGELCFRAPSLFPGYFKRPDITARSFTQDGYFRTGDLFILHDASSLGFYDRKKDMVIRGGFNISSAEVENAVQGHPKVADAAVIPVPDEIMGERVCVCVVLRDANVTLTLEELVDWLKQDGMSLYKLPERLRIVSEIPRNPVGKILKTKLRA